ncbi:MAG: hypothetical protein ACP5IZ_03990 [Thermoprotei archaeon]|jgi:uncharacterized membrane protein YjjP (DUF1212 family)
MSQRGKQKQEKQEDKIIPTETKRKSLEEPLRKQIYFMRMIIAVIAGIIAGILPPYLSQSIGFAIGILAYALSQYIAIKRYKRSPEENTQMLTIGIFSYVLLFLIVWSLTITLINPEILNVR